MLSVLAMAIFSRQLFGHWSFRWDFLGLYSASPAFVASTIGSGHPLAWSPFVASGLPVDVNPQAEVYFPLWWLFGGLGVVLNLTAVTIIQVSQVWLGSLGVLLLAHARRLSWPWALVAAIAYLVFGGFYGEAEHADIVRGFAYLPWLLWSLTPRDAGRVWLRLAALPPIAWMIVGGAYPAQTVSLAILASVYLIVVLVQGGPRVRRVALWALVLAGLSCAALAVAILSPYLLAVHRGQLHRVLQPTATVRAGNALGPIDLFGLYLNSFALHADGSITSWSLAVPILIGLVLIRKRTVSRQLPLAAAGAVALILAAAPKVGFIGRAMAGVGFLFPSRFPAADYKAGVALALILLSTEAWAGLRRRGERGERGERAEWGTVERSPALAGHRRPAPGKLAGVVLAGALIVGAVVAPSTYAPASRALWLLGAVCLITAALAWLRPRPRTLVIALVALIAVDGGREILSYRTFDGSAWAATPAQAAPFRTRDRYIARLGRLLFAAPVSRPPRVAPAKPWLGPTGDPLDDAGWDADGYHAIDYGGTIELARFQALSNPVFARLALAPWQAYVFPCPQEGCPAAAPRLPSASRWRPSRAVRTLSYGPGVNVYAVSLARPAIMVENELAIPGWQSDSRQVQAVGSGTPFRAWRLPAGTYTFTARYHQPDRPLQDSAAAIALLAWASSLSVLGVSRAGKRRRP